MTRQPLLRGIQGPAGRLEALLEPPAVPAGAPPRAAIVFAHPHPLYGGTMHTKGVYRATKTFGALGCAVLRFNFRGVGASDGQFDNARGELDDFRAGVDEMAQRFPGVPVWAAGFSFGAYVALVAGARDDRVDVLFGMAPPLHMYDFGPVKTSTKPKYFVQGALDEICPVARLQAFFAELPDPKRLEIVAGASHLFNGKMDELGHAVRQVVSDRV